MKTLYEANDGMIFKDADECLKYERMLKYANNDLYLLGDINGEYIPLDNILKNESLDDVFFIVCKSHEGLLQLCDLYDEFGYHIPKSWESVDSNKVPYRFFWNDDTGCWETPDRIYEKAKRLENIFENLAEKG